MKVDDKKVSYPKTNYADMSSGFNPNIINCVPNFTNPSTTLRACVGVITPLPVIITAEVF